MPLAVQLPTLHTTSLAAMLFFKNEASGLYEWMLHHALEGVSQFVLIDNLSTDNGACVAKRFAAHFPQLEIAIVNWSVPKRQHEAYVNFLPLVRREWVFFIDTDEYLWSTHSRKSTVTDVLSQLGARVDCVLLPYQGHHTSAAEHHPISVLNGATLTNAVADGSLAAAV